MKKSSKKNPNNKKFAEGICFDKLFLIFVTISIIGTLYEQILYLIKHYLVTNQIVWASRTAVIYGDFNMIYGLGAVIFIYLLGKKDRAWGQVVIYGALIGGTLEYLISLLQEIFVGTVSWDYSNLILNINGRTTIPIMIFWGILSCILVKVIYPKLSNIIEKISYKTGKLLVLILVIFLSLDMLISWTALLRQNFRRKGVEPFTPVGRFYDKTYPDKYLEKIYPNMVKR